MNWSSLKYIKSIIPKLKLFPGKLMINSAEEEEMWIRVKDVIDIITNTINKIEENNGRKKTKRKD